MTHRDATALLDSPTLALQTAQPQLWADLGCGSGVFTLALAEYLPSNSSIYAVDLRPTVKKQLTPGGVSILPQTADITQPNATLHSLDGILLANAIHYIADRPAFTTMLHTALKPGGILLIVEYDTDTPVPRWVPFPLSFPAAARLFAPPLWTPLQKGNTRPSTFGRSNLYTAITRKNK